mmetsp:Transcript_36095/g.65253  ORF Transcript_36095/g.65253 Transcript_36095/m.65253 type:complete len:214 (-) Transcript_36095:1284-1925(-)
MCWLVCMNVGVSQIPNLAGVVEGSGGEKMRRQMRETKNVDEILVQATEHLHLASCINVVEPDVDAKTACHDVVVRAIHRQRRELREGLQHGVFHFAKPALIIPQELYVARMRCTSHCPLWLRVEPRKPENRMDVDLSAVRLDVRLMVDDGDSSIFLADQHDLGTRWVELKLADPAAGVKQTPRVEYLALLHPEVARPLIPRAAASSPRVFRAS